MKESGLYGEAIIFGGAALTAAYDIRNSTMDIDALYRPRMEMYKIINEIAKKKRLDVQWLNDDIREFIGKDEAAFSSFPSKPLTTFSNLQVNVVDAEPLLAMKIMAARELRHDMPDAIELMKYLEIKDLEQVYDIVNQYKDIFNYYSSIQYDKCLEFAEEAYKKYSLCMQKELQTGDREQADLPSALPASFQENQKTKPMEEWKQKVSALEKPKKECPEKEQKTNHRD